MILIVKVDVSRLVVATSYINFMFMSYILILVNMRDGLRGRTISGGGKGRDLRQGKIVEANNFQDPQVFIDPYIDTTILFTYLSFRFQVIRLWYGSPLGD